MVSLRRSAIAASTLATSSSFGRIRCAVPPMNTLHQPLRTPAARSTAPMVTNLLLLTAVSAVCSSVILCHSISIYPKMLHNCITTLRGEE